MTGIEPWLAAGGVWLWESYGKDALAWLVKRWAKSAEDLKKAGWEQIDWARASHTYRHKLVELYGYMQIFGMPEKAPLGDIFTDLYLLDKPSAWRRHAIEELRARSQMHADPLEKEQRLEGTALVASRPRLFILGQPGSGKTTFLKHLVMQAIQGQFDAIPIFISLKVWSDTNVELLPFLVRQFAICNFPDAQPFVETILEDGKAIVLFDGLDEVNLEGGKRERITRAIREFAQQYGKSRVVITCRTAATEYVFEQFSYCELADFTQKQIEAFVARWFQKDEVKRAAFLKAFAQPDNQRLQNLARRPLLLTMLCITFEETMAFPQRRAELYEEAIDALLKKWDSSRSIQRDAIYRKLSLGYKRQLLMELAAETFERGEFFMPRRTLAERVTRFLRRLPPADLTEDVDGEAVLRSIEAQHGLLIERVHDIYSFSHLTFHEYFTARYIADHAEESVLRGMIAHADDTQWREVLLLTTSMLDYRNVAVLFRVWCNHLQQQIQGDTTLTALMESVARQAQAIDPSSGSMRAAVMTITMIDWGLVQVKDLISSLDHALARARTRVRDHARDHALARSLALDRTRARSLARALNRARATDIEDTFAHATDIEDTFALALALAHAYDPDLVHALASARAYDIASALHIVLTSRRVYAGCSRYQASRPHHSVGQMGQLVEHNRDWQLTRAQHETLRSYIASTWCLLECLNVAAVEEREGIVKQLFLPPGWSETLVKPSS